MTGIAIDAVNALTVAAFTARFGFLFEHSPWIVEAAAARRPFRDPDDMLAALMGVVRAASPERQRALLRAHPRLADKVALTPSSATEQASAGLDRLSAAEFARFHRLNDAYEERFGFPFIICVRLTDKAGILAAMERRLTASRETERLAALAQVGEIVRLRLVDALGP